MKCNVNRLLSLALVLVMLVVILPLTAKPVEAETVDDPLVDTYEYTFDEAAPSWKGNGSTATITLDDTVTQSGTGKSLKLTYTSNTKPQPYFFMPEFPNGIVAGNTYTMTVWFKTSADTIKRYIYMQAFKGTSGGALITAASTGVKDGDVNGAVVTISFVATETEATSLRILLGCDALASGQSVWFDNLVITETWTIENALAMGRDIVLTSDLDIKDYIEDGNLTLAEGQTIDLNGHALSANSVDGTAGGTLIDSSEAKSGRVIVGTTDEGVDMLYPAASNPQLPVKAADGSYALATVNLSDAYIQQTAASDEGFTLIFRPGFGTAEIVEMVGAGTSGVDMSLELTWTDVWGQSPDEPTTIKGFETVVASAYKNGKAIYAKFTNPGDTYQFIVKVNVTSSTGVTISSDVTLDADATYVNPTELGKHYYFASNFNSYSELPTEFKGRGDVSVKPVAASSSYDSLSMGTDAENGQYVVFDSEDKSEGMSFTLDLITDAANKQYAYTNLVVEMDFKLLNGDASSTGRSAQFLNVRKPTSGGTNLIYSTGGGGIRVIKADNTYANLGTFTTEWQTMKIEIDLDDQLAQVTMDGVDKGVYSIAQIYGNYFQITKTKGDGGMGIDNLKIYRYTDTNWNLTLPT